MFEKGRKRPCWIWFILPAAPYIFGGVEKGSPMTKRFALRGDEVVRAYLRFPPHDFELLEGILTTVTVDLQKNYVTLPKAILSQLESGNTLKTIFSIWDEPKAKSSLKLFYRVASEMDDQQEIAIVCGKILAMDES
jgi:uncharacterized protein (DUF1810 family)